MVRNDIKNSSLLKTKFLIYAFNGRTLFNAYFAPFSHVFHRSKGFCLYHFGVCLCLIASHLATNCTAFSTKMPCI